jgi:AcrR family transcriptional regulator
MAAPTRPTRQQSRSQRTRDQIAAAALSVFAAKGYAEASMDDICGTAGCSKGGLYHHFPTKSAVLGAVIARLQALGGLQPPLDGAAGAAGLDEAALGRFLIDLWAEAARSSEIRVALNGPAAGNASDGSLVAALRIGALIQQAALLPDAGSQAAVTRLSAPRAA